MASKLLIGAATAGGLAAGFSFAAAASGSHTPVHRPAAAEVRHLYDTEVALNLQERHLQALLEFGEAALAAKPAGGTHCCGRPPCRGHDRPECSNRAPVAPPTPAVAPAPAVTTTTTTTEPPATGGPHDDDHIGVETTFRRHRYRHETEAVGGDKFRQVRDR